MDNWKNWRVGQDVLYTVDEFDGNGVFNGKVTEKYDDHLIVHSGGMNLWCDDFNSDMFRRKI